MKEKLKDGTLILLPTLLFVWLCTDGITQLILWRAAA